MPNKEASPKKKERELIQQAVAKQKALEEELEKLKEENLKLKNDYDSIEKERDELKSKYDKLNENNTKTEDELKRISQEKEEIELKYETMKKQTSSDIEIQLTTQKNKYESQLETIRVECEMENKKLLAEKDDKIIELSSELKQIKLDFDYIKNTTGNTENKYKTEINEIETKYKKQNKELNESLEKIKEDYDDYKKHTDLEISLMKENHSKEYQKLTKMKDDEIESLRQRLQDVQSIDKVLEKLHDNSSSIKSLYERVNADRDEYVNKVFIVIILLLLYSKKLL